MGRVLHSSPVLHLTQCAVSTQPLRLDVTVSRQQSFIVYLKWFAQQTRSSSTFYKTNVAKAVSVLLRKYISEMIVGHRYLFQRPFFVEKFFESDEVYGIHMFEAAKAFTNIAPLPFGASEVRLILSGQELYVTVHGSLLLFI